MSAISTGPPPWPIPPSWAPSPSNPPESPTDPPPAPAQPGPPAALPEAESTGAEPEPAENAEPEAAASTVVVFRPDGTLAPEGGVPVETRPLSGTGEGFELARELAQAAGQAVSDGARGVVVAPEVAAPEETAWALDLLYAGDAPLVLVPAPTRPEDLADAVAVAAADARGLGCVLVTHGEIHAARHVTRTSTTYGSPSAGPLGHVTGGSVRLLWRPPARVTVPASQGDRSPLVGLHTVGLGDDGRALRALAEHCDGLIVAGSVPDHLAATLTELAERIPVIPTGPALNAPKARILMHLLLEAGHDRESVLAAFTAAAHPDGARL